MEHFEAKSFTAEVRAGVTERFSVENLNIEGTPIIVSTPEEAAAAVGHIFASTDVEYHSWQLMGDADALMNLLQQGYHFEGDTIEVLRAEVIAHLEDEQSKEMAPEFRRLITSGSEAMDVAEASLSEWGSDLSQYMLTAEEVYQDVMEHSGIWLEGEAADTLRSIILGRGAL